MAEVKKPHRRTIGMSNVEYERLKARAEAQGVTMSDLIRGWIEDFVVSKGKGVSPTRQDVEIQVNLDPDLAENAKRAARAAGTTIPSIVRRALNEN